MDQHHIKGWCFNFGLIFVFIMFPSALVQYISCKIIGVFNAHDLGEGVLFSWPVAGILSPQKAKVEYEEMRVVTMAQDTIAN